MSAPRAPYLPTPRPGWKLVPLRRLGDTASGSGFPPSLQGQSGHEIAFYKVKHLGAADRHGVLPQPDDTIDRATADELHATVFPAGTFVYAKVGAALMLGRVRSLPRPACIDNNMAGLVPRADVDSRFLFWAITRVKFDFLVNPGAVPSLSDKNLLAYPILVPPRDEQRAIADYLDHETAQIDTLIAKQEQMIATLRERRGGLIERALVGGLDPAVRLRTTVIPWLAGASVPAHWETTRVKYLALEMRAGEGITAEDIEDVGAYRVFGGNGLRGYATAYTHSGTFVLIGRQGALCGNVHLVHGEFWASEHAIVVTPSKRVDARWLAHMLWLMNLGQYSMTTAQPGIGVGQIGPLMVPLPPLDEQREIATYIDEQASKIDTLIAKTERFIELSKERRAALITAAVTGQIDVRASA